MQKRHEALEFSVAQHCGKGYHYGTFREPTNTSVLLGVRFSRKLFFHPYKKVAQLDKLPYSQPSSLEVHRRFFILLWKSRLRRSQVIIITSAEGRVQKWCGAGLGPMSNLRFSILSTLCISNRFNFSAEVHTDYVGTENRPISIDKRFGFLLNLYKDQCRMGVEAL